MQDRRAMDPAAAFLARYEALYARIHGAQITEGRIAGSDSILNALARKHSAELQAQRLATQKAEATARAAAADAEAAAKADAKDEVLKNPQVFRFPVLS